MSDDDDHETAGVSKAADEGYDYDDDADDGDDNAGAHKDDDDN